MRFSPRHLLAHRRRRRTCGQIGCRLVDGRCESCGFGLVERTKDRERLLDPHY